MSIHTIAPLITQVTTVAHKSRSCYEFTLRKLFERERDLARQLSFVERNGAAMPLTAPAVAIRPPPSPRLQTPPSPPPSPCDSCLEPAAPWTPLLCPPITTCSPDVVPIAAQGQSPSSPLPPPPPPPGLFDFDEFDFHAAPLSSVYAPLTAGAVYVVVEKAPNVKGFPDSRPSGSHSSAHGRPFKIYDRPSGSNKNCGLVQGNANSGASKTGVKEYSTDYPYSPCSIADFLFKANVLTFGGVKTGQGNSMQQSYKNAGVDKITNKESGAMGKCWEISKEGSTEEPCMLWMNKIAAYYGLYYYPQCTEPSLNEAVYENMGSLGWREIRVRCPNPKFGVQNWYSTKNGTPFENNKLFVREPLNPLNRQVLEEWWPKLDRRRKFDYVGGVFPNSKDPFEHKFEVPRITKIAPSTNAFKQHTHSPWASLINQDNISQVAPFFNDGKNFKWHKLVDTDLICFFTAQRLLDLGVKSVSNITKHTNGDLMNFGFRVPAAFLFWPHVMPEQADLRWAPSGFTWSAMPQYMNDPRPSVNYETPMHYATLQNAKTVSQLQAFGNGGNVTSKKNGTRLELARMLLNWSDYATDDFSSWRNALLSEAGPSAAPERQPTLPDAPRPATPPRSLNKKPPSRPRRPVRESRSTVNYDEAEEMEDTGNADGAGAQDTPRTDEPDEAQTKPDDRRFVQQAFATDMEEVDEETGYASLIRNTYEEMLASGEKVDFDYVNDAKLENDVKLLIKQSRRKVQAGKEAQEPSGKLRGLWTLLKRAGLLSKSLPAGSQRKSTSDNSHFLSLQPFAFKDLYEDGTLEFRYKDVEQDMMAEWQRTHGREPNTYEGKNMQAQIVENYKSKFGRARSTADGTPFLDLRLDDQLFFDKFHFMYVLAIYFCDDGVGIQGLPRYIDTDMKRQMMHLGIWVASQTAQTPFPIPMPGKKKKDKRTGSSQQLWNAVFTGEPSALLKKVFKEDADELVSIFTSFFSNCEDETYWDKNLRPHGGVQAVARAVPSTMLVREWITTPWHLQYLPYRKAFDR